MTMSFKEFIAAYNDGSILKDAAWRAYDIEAMATEMAADDAMNVLRYKMPGRRNRLGQVAEDYGIVHVTRAEKLLALWWAWARIALGERKGQLKLREG